MKQQGRRSARAGCVIRKRLKLLKISLLTLSAVATVGPGPP